MFFDKLLSFVYPKRCLICMKKFSENSTYACEKCTNIIKYNLNGKIDEFIFNRHFDRLISCFFYEGIIRRKILAFKFENKPYIGRLFAQVMSKLLIEKNIVVDVVVPVPSYWTRYFKRGYNQSLLLAKWIARNLNVKCDCTNLKKVKKSAVQSLLNYSQRMNNVLNTYAAKNKFDGKTVLLVDDIYTTGATVNECSRILKEIGAKKVIVVTIAHARFRKEE